MENENRKQTENRKQKAGIQVFSQTFCVFRDIHVANAHNAMTWLYLSPLLYVVVLMMEMTSGMQFTVEMLNRSSEVFTDMSEGMCGVMQRLYYFNDMATGAYVGCCLTNIRLVECGPLTRNQKFKTEFSVLIVITFANVRHFNLELSLGFPSLLGSLRR